MSKSLEEILSNYNELFYEYVEKASQRKGRNARTTENRGNKGWKKISFMPIIRPDMKLQSMEDIKKMRRNL